MTITSTAIPAPCSSPAGRIEVEEHGVSVGIGRLLLLVSIVVSFLAGSSAPTPLYATYQHAWGFSLISTTVVFAVYALAVLAGLLFLARLSDHLGRRNVILGAIALQILAMLVFATATSLDALFLGRMVQGVATGGALGAIGAAMLEASPRHGAIANSAAPGAGTGLGALASGVFVGYLPAPTHAIYLALAAVLLVQLLAVGAALEPSGRRPGIWASLAPRVGVPSGAREAVVSAAPVLFAVWALAGFYGSLSPALLHALSGSTSVVLAGFTLFLLAVTASVATVALREAPPALVLRVGLVGLAAGIAGTLIAIAEGSVVGFLLATVASGIGFGSGFQGGLRTVLSRTTPAERAGVLSMIYVISYLGMGVPAVVAGWLVVEGHALVSVAEWYGAFLLVLAAITAVRSRRSESAAIQLHRSVQGRSK